MKWNVWSLDQNRWMMLESTGIKARAEAALKDRQQGWPGERFEVRKVRPVMEQHGTRLMQLKPAMVWRMAMEDLSKRDLNKQGSFPGFKQYSFHRHHVRGAESANDILRAAIADPERGRASEKEATRLLYADLDLLRAALQ